MLQSSTCIPQADTRVPQAETKEESVLLTMRRFLDFGRCATDGCRR
ncbi:hypothetical protein ACIQKE_21220 [Streptomyces griseoviridis]|uniref:Uncharacterized protein n=1 Tax=Streptomyces hintoniae TaxID=3075521 RepID=A0ABU2UWN9_9ACTN|nr:MULTISPECIES: hypothetical protein [unclassified Streptomyces]MDH6702566.1 hypothetical protein [Streptomyces sp. MAA16]MDT0477724.1 hypothetical protein [Streptomyces sp. DSM 41014]